MGRWGTGGLFGGFPAAFLLGGAAAGVVGIGLGEPLGTAATAGAGVCALVMLNHLVSTRQARREKRSATDGTPGGRSRSVASTAPREAAEWLRRAGKAADRLAEHQRNVRADDSGVTCGPALRQLLDEAATVSRSAADQLAERMAAVGVIDAVRGGADSAELRTEEARLAREAQLTESEPVRRAKEESARAVGDQAASLERLEELRRRLLAALQSLTLRLESVVKHVGMLLSVQAADAAAGEASDTAPLAAELRAVEEGLTRLAELARDDRSAGGPAANAPMGIDATPGRGVDGGPADRGAGRGVGAEGDTDGAPDGGPGAAESQVGGGGAR